AGSNHRHRSAEHPRRRPSGAHPGRPRCALDPRQAAPTNQEPELAFHEERDRRQSNDDVGARRHRIRGRRNDPVTRAYLALADGTLFEGQSFGSDGHTTGEVVFTTGMSGYQEVLTDPSYTGQIVTMTAPHIGNTGINELDPESVSGIPNVAGFVVRDQSP